MLTLMTIQSPVDPTAWDAYVSGHFRATLYHLSGWLRVIRKTYGHSVYSLAAVEANEGRIIGILPLVHMKHPMFGNSLVSMPFFDMGGILADSPAAEQYLLDQALILSRQLGATGIELRHTTPINSISDKSQLQSKSDGKPVQYRTLTHKVRMLIDLPGSSEALMKTLRSKLRSQINRPIKDGLQVKSGGAELVDDFYGVFLENMRDLGSPVHAKQLIENVVAEFPDRSRIFLVHKDGQTLAAALTVGFNETLENPWASALRRFSRWSPNMLLYWGMLAYAADHGFARFDFGRSTPGEGTFKFKEQWGSRPEPLHWYLMGWCSAGSDNADVQVSRPFEIAAKVWKRLPIAVTRIIGPSSENISACSVYKIKPDDGLLLNSILRLKIHLKLPLSQL